MSVCITISDTQAKSIAAQTFSEVSDADFEKLFMRIVREGKYRRNLDFENMLEKARKAWSVEKDTPAKTARAKNFRDGF